MRNIIILSIAIFIILGACQHEPQNTRGLVSANDYILSVSETTTSFKLKLTNNSDQNICIGRGAWPTSSHILINNGSHPKIIKNNQENDYILFSPFSFSPPLAGLQIKPQETITGEFPFKNFEFEVTPGDIKYLVHGIVPRYC